MTINNKNNNCGIRNTILELKRNSCPFLLYCSRKDKRNCVFNKKNEKRN